MENNNEYTSIRRTNTKIFLIMKVFMFITDSLFFVYWSVSLIICLGGFKPPASLMYKDYQLRHVESWNWSFFPIDMIFTTTGFLSLYLDTKPSMVYKLYSKLIALISLICVHIAGNMAISYWILMNEYDVSWFLMNAMISIWPLPFIYLIIDDLVNQVRNVEFQKENNMHIESTDGVDIVDQIGS